MLPLTAGDVDELDATLAAALVVAGVTADDAVVSLVPHRGIAAALAKLKARLVVPAGPGAAGLGSATVAFAPSHADVDAARGQVRLVVGTADGVDRPFLGRPETGVIAAACGHGSRLHVLESQHVEIGEQGELLVTPLGRRGAPLLRYATGDRARFRPGSACPCGSTLPQLELLA